jgi:glycosyltransferase involved in cell wall biosynthesis
MSDPLVSIVIPSFNGSRYLPFAIESALSQTYAAVEVIVVNDGSRDEGKTRQIAEGYGDRVIYLEKENGGVATALNSGIAIMKGQFFSWLSHDDAYYPEKIEGQLRFLEESRKKRAIIYSHEDQIDSEGRILRKAKGFEETAEPFPYRLMYSHFIGGCSLLIPRSAFEEAGSFNSDYRTVQDYDLWFRMIKAGYEFLYCPITSGMSRQHEGQDSRTKLELCRREQERLYIQVQETLPRALWLDPFEDRALAIFRLGQEFKKLGLEAVYEYDEGLLKKELNKRRTIPRLLLTSRFFALRIKSMLDAFSEKKRKRLKRAVSRAKKKILGR